MVDKIKHVSTDPNFKPFTEWAAAEIASLQSQGRTAEANEIINAIALKEAANANTRFYVDENGFEVADPANVTVPEFNAVFNRWAAQYQVVYYYPEE
jgi:hypothetical protein